MQYTNNIDQGIGQLTGPSQCRSVTDPTTGFMDNSALRFGGLSPELIIQVLHYCESSTILRFGATCKLFYNIVTRSVSLQLHLELEANGLEILNGSFEREASYAVVLRDLRRFRDAWLDLDFSRPVEKMIGNSEMLLWELREGFYIRAFSQNTRRFSDTIQFIPLDPGIPERSPLLFDFEFNEFTADPDQGLLAILSRAPHMDPRIYVHLRSSDTGLAHPLASHPRLTAEFDFEPPYFWPGYSIEVMGHIVLVKVMNIHDYRYGLLIWDWSSGALLNRISSQGAICDFAFLDEQHLVVSSGRGSNQAHLDTLELLIFALSKDDSAPTNSNGYVRVADLPVSEPVLRLGFPPIKDSSKLSHSGFFLRAQPTPGRAMHTSSATLVYSHATTLSMTFCFREAVSGFQGPPYYRVFIDGKFIRDQLRTIPQEGTTKVLPWSLWGRKATRWSINLNEPDHWICWMSGSRYIAPLPTPPYYGVFDFSPQVVRRFRDRFSQSNPSVLDHMVDLNDRRTTAGFHDIDHLSSILDRFSAQSPLERRFCALTVGEDNPSVIEDGEDLGFKGRIISQLPYRLVFRTDNKKGYEAWQINGDYIIGINTLAESESLAIYKLNR
ncbi:unnamed protein product [Rhizoctonia solani]|uniref:F-box domain-containing protein n=1 Tax=Rhizoctonia solani TaxID=456999 RepID=A0A8H3BGR7_9AGAM|nr:unnamed protein product [Rhizoctonia solani]